MKHKYTFRLQFERAGFVDIEAETPQEAIEEFEDNMDEYNEQCDYSYDDELHWQLIEEDGETVDGDEILNRMNNQQQTETRED